MARNTRLDVAGSLIIALAFIALWAGLGSSIVDTARHKDFLNLYVGGTLASEGRFGELHDQSVQFAVQRGIDPEAKELWPFVRPHFYALFLSWLPLLPFGVAFWTWIGVQVAALFGCWAWAVRRFGFPSLIFSAMYLPTALGVAHGQDCVLMLVIAVSSYTLHSSGRRGWAGAVLALSLFKFHLLLLFPLALWAAGERRMFRGYLFSAIALTAFSMVLAGPSGVGHYVHMLTDPTLSGLNPSPERTVSVFGLARSLPWPYLWTAIPLVAGVVLATRLAVRNAPAWRWWAASLVGCLLAVPHVYGYDAAVILLAIWLVFAHGETAAAKLTAALCATPLPFFAGLGPPPQSGVPALALIALLGALAWENMHSPTTAPVESDPVSGERAAAAALG